MYILYFYKTIIQVINNVTIKSFKEYVKIQVKYIIIQGLNNVNYIHQNKKIKITIKRKQTK